MRKKSDRYRELVRRFAVQDRAPLPTMTMTLRDARKTLAAIGWRIDMTGCGSEYRVYPRNGVETETYYTDDLSDAVSTAQAEHKRETHRLGDLQS